MRSVLKYWILLAAMALVGSAAWAESFTATMDRDSMVLGDQAQLSLTFEGGSPRMVPAPDVPGLQFTQTGTSQSYSIVNSQMTALITINFTVTAQKSGDFTIPSLAADIGGRKYTTNPIKLTVTRANAPSTSDVNSGNEVAFMKLVLPKDHLYVGQPVVAQLQLYLRDDVQRWGNFSINSMPADGLSLGKLTDLQNQAHQTIVGNRRYTVIPLAMPLTPVQAGKLELGPVSVNIAVLLPSPNQGGDQFIRTFFNEGQQKQLTLATDPITIESLPLPDQNKPANFGGAIGNFTMTASAGPNDVIVGDPITVRARISGEGGFDTVMLPLQNAWQDFKTYPPTSKFEASDQFGFEGTKTFEQIISPENANLHEIPALSFSFFNPDDGQYHTLTQAAVPLTVHAAGATPMPAVAAAKPAATENQSPQDIVSIKDNLGTLAAAQTPLIVRPAFLAAQSLPVLAFLVAFVWRKRMDNLANNPRLRRRRAVVQLVSVGLIDLKKFAAENNPDQFFALLFRLLQEQLGERLDCPATAITQSAADDLRRRLDASPATVESLHELFQLCDQARYAPVRGTSELNSVAGRFEKTVAEVQELKA